MSASSAIEWTDATWNPVTGCDRCSPGCDHCYIERTPPFRTAGRRFDEHGKMGVQLHPERLEKPLHWRKPRRIFVNSLSDLFHPDVPDQFIEGVLAVMNIAKQHTFQVLTKRPQRMANLLQRTSWDINGDVHIGRYTADELAIGDLQRRWYDVAAHLPNVWWGTSIENQTYAWRARHLLDTPAAVRFLSCEPLLAPLELKPTYLDGIDWLIAGGESGPGARPMHPDWPRSLRDQCIRYGVAFHFKQWGEWEPLGPLYDQDDDYDEQADMARMDAAALEVDEGTEVIELETDGTIVYGYQPGDHRTWLMARTGKKHAGRSLDDRTWDEWPTAVSGKSPALASVGIGPDMTD